jgi:lipid-A-disaccharide synthase
MAAAGCRLHTDLTALAVVWFGRVLLNLPKFWNLVSRADRFFRHRRPAAVVLIDYPGLNWWIARRAKAHNIPVFYYTPPQIWAWAQWRVRKMRRLVDHVLCALPFEESWFRQHGCNATFVGHPFFDDLRQRQLDAIFCQQYRSLPGPLVTILPGSRTQEVLNNLPWFLKAAAIVRSQVPEVRLALAAYNVQQAQLARKQIAAAGLHVDVHVGRTAELMHLAECCMACSGSVSLELLYYAKPTVILYWINPLAYVVQGFFRKVKYITLVNLLTAEELFPDDLTPFDPSQPGAEKVLFPEYLTCEDKSAQIAKHIISWLTNPAERQARVNALLQVKKEVAQYGASARAAQYILDAVCTSTATAQHPFRSRSCARPAA